MNRFEVSRPVWFFMFIVAMALVVVALFLHPMSPEDFLSLAFSDPLQTVTDTQGSNVAIFFWICTALAVLGLSGLLTQSTLLRRLLYPPKYPPKPKLRALRH